ncbi:MAG TPA: hypothetical protein VNA14_00300 [Mycobacteriales bacterium]|nr:hypothetical protein [Mycobacteriales bacterium]
MRRILAPLAAVVVLALAVPSHAGSFSYADPADMPANGGLDILSVTYATTGKGKGKAYVPSTLVATMTLSATPVEQPGVGYEIAGAVDGCGEFTFSYTPGTVASAVIGEALLTVGCGGTTPVSEGQILTPKFEVTGSTLTWSIGLKALPKETRAGSVLTSLVSRVDFVEPGFGSRPVQPAPGVFDTATTDKSWKIS